MGEFLKGSDIASVSKVPSKVSLASNPNYIEFCSRPKLVIKEQEKAGEEENIGDVNNRTDIKLTVETAEYSEYTIMIKDLSTKEEYKIRSTKDVTQANSSTFLQHERPSITAENIRRCLLKIPYIKGNFDVVIPIMVDETTAEAAKEPAIRITAKKAASNSQISTTVNPLYTKWEDLSSEALKTDTMTEGMELPDNVQIELEIYRDTNVTLGVDDRTTLGVPATSLSKAYFGQAIWFDVNSIWRNQHKYSDAFLRNTGWCDAGTVTNFRFLAKRNDGVISDTFYISDPLYAITGYNRSLEENNLDKYVFNIRNRKVSVDRKIKPLTTQGVATHIKGQSQYFNFILANAYKETNDEFGFELEYELISSSGKIIDLERKTEDSLISQKKLNAVNTIKLDLDSFLFDELNEGYSPWTDEEIKLSKRIDLIRVYLTFIDSEGTVQRISEPMEFKILPNWLYPIHEFAFLNSVGGWSSFNFSGKEQTDFKTSAETVHKTQTPHSTISSDIESVFSKQVQEQFVVETMPLNAAAADWLRELSTSVAVYEIATQRYVIVDELSVKTNSKDELFALQMKYKYSDSYNGNVKE